MADVSSAARDVYTELVTSFGSSKEPRDLYGTASVSAAGGMVHVDGAPEAVKCHFSVNCLDGDRVIVRVIDHRPVVISNLTNPDLSTAEVISHVKDNPNTGVIQNVVVSDSTLQDIDLHGFMATDGTIENTKISGGSIDGATLTNIPYAAIDNLDAHSADIADARIGQATIKQAQVEDLVADKATINGKISAAEGDIDNLKAKDAEIEGTLTAANADITNLKAKDATIEGNISAATGRISSLETDHVSTTDLQATNAHIGELEADTAKIHSLTADELSAATGYIADLKADNIEADTLSANVGKIKDLTGESLSYATGYIADLQSRNITTGNIQAATGFVGTLGANDITAQNVVADHGVIGTLDSHYAHITNGVIDNATIGYAQVNNLAANYAQINAANITDLTAQNGWLDKVMVQTGMIAHEGAVYTLDAIQVNAANITAGTIDVERLIVTVDGQKYMVHIDPSTSQPSYEKLDGNIIEPRTITADKIVAGAITANEITTENIVGSGGWINLRNGTFNYHNAANTAYISWDGANLNIVGSNLNSAITGLTQTVSDNKTSIENRASAIEQNLNGITTRVSKTEAQIAGQFATCSTAAGTQAKAATITPASSTWTLETGSTVTVRFTAENTHATPTLNVNGTGAKSIRTYSGAALGESDYKWKENTALTFTYDGTYWRIQDSISSRVSTAETAIEQTANNVLIKATQSDTTAAQGGQHLIQSLINVAPSGVTINADKVNIEGAAIFTGSGRLSQDSLDNAYDASGTASAAQAAAISAAAADATSKANAAQSAATSAAAADATSKANAAQAAAEATAAADATSKANAAQAAAEETAAADATSKANAARDAAISAAATDATNKANAANAMEQLIYKSAAAGTSSMAATTSWVTSTSDTQNAWTTKRPTYSQSYPVLFVATQRKTVGGTVTCTTPMIDATTTVIDGGNIITGSVTANQLSANSVTADKIAANAITIGTVSGLADELDAKADSETTDNRLKSLEDNTAGYVDATFVPDEIPVTIINGQLTVDKIDVDSLRAALLQVANLLIGEASSAHIQASGSRMSFMNGEQEVAYIDIDQSTGDAVFYMTRSIVVKDMQFGDGLWKWYKRSNNNMSVKWMGGM